MLVCRGKSVPLPTNAVRAYRISTIVDAEGGIPLGLAAVRAYRISTIVDRRCIIYIKVWAVRAFLISTIIDDTAEGLLLARTVKAY